MLGAVAVERANQLRTEGTASPRARWRRTLQAVLYASPVVGFLCAGFAHRWITDDGFIYLRVVQQIRAGNGPVFNAGERVEVFTGTLWVALLTVADVLTPVRLEWLSVLLGLACGAAGLGLAVAGARKLLPDQPERRWYLPFGAVVFVAVTPVWVFATSGLETGLVFGWLGTCLWVLATWARAPAARMPYPSAVLLGLGWLIRPELLLFSVAFIVVVFVAERRRTELGRQALIVVAAAALPLAYQLFRMGFYGSLVPNTAVAKEGGSTNWERGWRYLRDFADAYWLWVPALALLAGGYLPLATSLTHRRGQLVTGAFATCGLLNLVYMMAVGGDYIHARLLLPGFFAICAPVAVVPAVRRNLAAAVVAPWAIAAMFVFRPSQYEQPVANGFVMPKAAGLVTADDYGWGQDGPARAWYTGPAVYYQAGMLQFRRSNVDPHSDVELPIGMFAAVGMVGYASGPDFFILDVFGLADSLTAHLDPSPESPPVLQPLAGHEKPLPPLWAAALVTSVGSQPDPSQFVNMGHPLIDPATGQEFYEQIAWARATLKCEAIARLRGAATARLTVGQFTENVLNAFENSRLRIPANPEKAYQRFCGPGVPAEVRELRSE
jgi:arabinofuranosyltransferase